MKQLHCEAIVLARTDYGEADRIITVLTPAHGKLRLMARGVRKLKSKLAGGIELFSVSQLTFIKGRGSLDTLVSARLERHYGHIVQDIGRTMLGYELIKRLDRATEDQTEPDYFMLLQQTFAALDDHAVPAELIRMWFMMQLLRLSGHTPNLQTDASGQKLAAGRSYNFSYDDMAFGGEHVPAEPGQAGQAGAFTANHIKFLRLGFAGHPPQVLAQVQGQADLASAVGPLVQTMLQTHVRA